MSDKENCENCESFKEINNVSGKCCLGPPQLIAGGRGGTGVGAWLQPVVSQNDWCAMHDAGDSMEEIEGGGKPSEDRQPAASEDRLAEMMGGKPKSKTASRKKAVKK
jgi:hypothetical protein